MDAKRKQVVMGIFDRKEGREISSLNNVVTGDRDVLGRFLIAGLSIRTRQWMRMDAKTYASRNKALRR